MDNLPITEGWLTYLCRSYQAGMATQYKDLPTKGQFEVCVKENVLVQIENLRTHPSVLAALASGKLRLHAWVYEIESGNVMAFDDQTGQCVPVGEAGYGVAERTDRLSAIR